jgi:hypothetical protein
VKNTKCPSTDEWISKLWYPHTKEYHSVFKKEGKSDTYCNMVSLVDIMLSVRAGHRKANTINSTCSRYQEKSSSQAQKVEWCFPGIWGRKD